MPQSAADHEPSTKVANGSPIHSFSRFAARAAAVVGSSTVFLLACLGVVIWGFSGPFFRFSNTWQLVVNTATTIITFLMVFLLQNTQNRDTRAINLKLDEIIRSINRAHNEMINIEKLSDEELEELAKRYEKIREESDHRAAARLLNDAKKKIPAA